MKRGKFQKKGSSVNKGLVLVLVLTLLVGSAIGGTIAWLMDKTGEVKNTFTVGKVDIDLTETKPTNNSAKMIPGCTIDKNPTVSVTDDSEDCYVFVKVEKSRYYDTYLKHDIAEGWEELEVGVYYRTVKADDTIRSFSVLKGDKVTVLDTVTSTDMTAADGSEPTLTFTAYAIQMANGNSSDFSPEDAWAKVNPIG